MIVSIFHPRIRSSENDLPVAVTEKAMHEAWTHMENAHYRRWMHYNIQHICYTIHTSCSGEVDVYEMAHAASSP